MDNARGHLAPAEPAEVSELRTRADAVRDTLAAAASEGPGRDLRHLVGIRALVAQLQQLEPSAERSAWVMQPSYFYDPEDPGVELTHAALARGVQTLLLTRPATVQTHPLLPSIFPTARLAPVFLRAMVVDEERLVVEGPDTANGDRTAWYTTRKSILDGVLDIWHRTLPLSTPILPPGTQPPLSRRQLEVARLLAVGEKDVSIARLLNMSARTVERDVRTILHELGAGSRTEAVLVMLGRGVNGGQPMHGDLPRG
ncbi:MAG: helix-turn-helix transcriptional regulator [Marmoricola sp.]